MDNNIFLIGAGEHARVVLDCLLDQSLVPVAMIDPKFENQTIMGVTVFGTYNQNMFQDAETLLAIGSNEVRRKLTSEIKHPYFIARHSSSIVSKHASIGKGSMVLHGVVVQQGAAVGEHVILNTRCQIDHDCKIKNFVHIAPGSVLCGRVTVGEGSLIGAGSILLPGVTVGNWATIGAGSVVINDIPNHAVAIGNPAKVIKYKENVN